MPRPGVCQAMDIDGTDASIVTSWHKHNSTTEHHTRMPPTAHSNQPHAVKGEPPWHDQPFWVSTITLIFSSELINLLVFFCLFVFPRHGRRHLPEVHRLQRGPLLRQTLLVSHLQARADWGPGVHAPPQERHSRLGALPALRLRRGHDLPTREGGEGPRRQQDCSAESTHLSETLKWRLGRHRDTQTPGKAEKKTNKQKNQSQTLTDKIPDLQFHLRCWQTNTGTGTQRHSFLPKCADTNSTRKDGTWFLGSWYTQRDATFARQADPISPVDRWGDLEVTFQKSRGDRCMSSVTAERFCFSFYGTLSLGYCSKLLYCKYCPGGGT